MAGHRAERLPGDGEILEPMKSIISAAAAALTHDPKIIDVTVYPEEVTPTQVMGRHEPVGDTPDGAIASHEPHEIWAQGEDIMNCARGQPTE